tara:strand:- start:496 stop:1716 length:1221 start_codon:yes stop_codon:yes gene_type:complete
MNMKHMPLILISGLASSTYADGAIFADMDFRLRTGPNTSFNILTQQSTASGVAVIQPGTCSPYCNDINTGTEVDSRIGPGLTLVDFNVGVGDGGSCQVSVYLRSRAFTSSSVIHTSGTVSGSGSGDQCNPMCNLGGSMSSYIDYELVVTGGGPGSIYVDSPFGCTFSASDNLNRTVSANIVCIVGANGTALLPSSSTQIGFNFAENCATTAPGIPGIYNLSSVYISITDPVHDVTGDGRFNIEDATFLQGIIGTSDALLPTYVDRFDYNLDGEVDQLDVNIVHKFIDAGLSSGLFGDTNRDGVVDCCDISGFDAAFGSLFYTTNTEYLVELDWDLDGDIDAIDQAEFNSIACDADLDNTHVLDFFDVNLFLSLYGAGDLAADFTGDGILDFFDVNSFLDTFSQVCP